MFFYYVYVDIILLLCAAAWLSIIVSNFEFVLSSWDFKLTFYYKLFLETISYLHDCSCAVFLPSFHYIIQQDHLKIILYS